MNQEFYELTDNDHNAISELAEALADLNNDEYDD